MAPSKSNVSLSKKTGNKLHRKSLYVKQKQENEKEKRADRFRRKKEETQDPELRRERLEKNKPLTIDRKRVWDDVDDDGLYASVNMEQLLKKRKQQQEEAEELAAMEANKSDEESHDDDVDSMLGSDDEDEDEEDSEAAAQARARKAIREGSPAISTTSTNLELTPQTLIDRFPTLFESAAEPKVLVTTSLNATIHEEAQKLCGLFPNSSYVPRSSHKYGHKYSVREISKFAANRGYTTVVIAREDLKRIHGMDIVHLPSGPTFHFSISNWIDVKKLPGHGNATNHYPELLLNNFNTPLGFLTATLFKTLFPPSPEIQGRQVVTFHNQRDYIFVRRHRYIFREKKATEKSVVGADGKEMKGVKDIRAPIQELGPRFTLKLRRIDKGIGRAGSEGDDALQWQWKAKMEKQRTRFNL
ncbi:Ribosome production factor 1 [Pestalotiopsis sp. IQ-011]